MVNEQSTDDGAVDFTLRPAERDDVHAIAELYVETRQQAIGLMPPPIHSAAEDREFFGRVIDGPAEMWVAEEVNGPQPVAVAFLVIEGDWLNSLYVRPGWTSQGIGTALLDFVKAARPGGFALWVFESNTAARRFYERHGLVAVRRTDGSGNEERAPDLHMLWPGRDPIPALRDAIDQVDRELARLLEIRSGLTAQVQPHKTGDLRGPAPRDPAREAEIVASMAPYAPRLGSGRLAVIMQAVIAESLDAVESETNREHHAKPSQ